MLYAVPKSSSCMSCRPKTSKVVWPCWVIAAPCIDGFDRMFTRGGPRKAVLGAKVETAKRGGIMSVGAAGDVPAMRGMLMLATTRGVAAGSANTMSAEYTMPGMTRRAPSELTLTGRAGGEEERGQTGSMEVERLNSSIPPTPPTLAARGSSAPHPGFETLRFRSMFFATLGFCMICMPIGSGTPGGLIGGLENSTANTPP
ncbi:hypothetical protein T484DRAFT_1972521, partial [Baffinella frigidus]